jgi:hypothetical protein
MFIEHNQWTFLST